MPSKATLKLFFTKTADLFNLHLCLLSKGTLNFLELKVRKEHKENIKRGLIALHAWQVSLKLYH